MKIKKYIAPSMPEAMNQIRKELGSDAVILNSKEILQGGFLGFFKKKNIEVVAALDPQPLETKMSPKPPVGSKISRQMQPSGNREVLEEIKNLKKLMAVQTKQRDQKFLPEFQVAYEHLLDQEVEVELAEDIIQSVINQFENSKEEQDMGRIMNGMTTIIENKLNAIGFHGLEYDKKVIQFVGPTGVGKTTTIAKIAAKMMLEDQKRIAFITADTYRIGAVEQLKTYARILDVPLEVAYTIEDYYSAIEKFASFDFILVDTAGRNYRDQKYINELKTTIDTEMMNTYLVLSLTTKQKDITEIFNQFQHLSIQNVILTKLDETTQYGSILNISLGNQIGIACMTNGQDVPEDLMEAKPEKISRLVVGEQSEI
ncbi:flagellar biosynthesis protein FlhF [Oceanobacillus sp. CF4.6]|uniref:flagellar biosynthesis protein FlhF n=1 Tax=Oceanobacillus sp. CF4.6 TaxID=3373080 RepID=UPI003EE66853